MKLDNVIFGLLIILVLFVISALLCEFTGYEPCNKLYQLVELKQTNLAAPAPIKKKASIRRLLNSSAEGMIRGVLMGSITGGVMGATSYGVALGVINPFMIVFLESLPHKQWINY